MFTCVMMMGGCGFVSLSVCLFFCLSGCAPFVISYEIFEKGNREGFVEHEVDSNEVRVCGIIFYVPLLPLPIP